MKTCLGWTLMGKTHIFIVFDSTKSVMSLHGNYAKILDLWRLDTLGILDPGESGNKQEIEKLTEQHFYRSIKIDEEGTYEVSLPWIENHLHLPTGRKIIERQLRNCV